MALPNDNDDPNPQGNIPYENQIWDGTLPAATGDIAKEFHKLTTDDQTNLATTVYDFLQDNTNDITKLNAEHRLFSIIINVPQTNLLKVAYGLAYGTSGIGEASPLDSKILMLTGEGNQSVGCPTAIELPNSIRTIQQMKCPTDTQVQTALGTNKTSWHRFRTNNIDDETVVDIMQLAPIPTFLIYDGFNKDISAEKLYERILSIANQNNDMIIHCKKFLRACMVLRNQPDSKPHTAPSHFMATPSPALRKWAKTKFTTMFPMFNPQPQVHNQPNQGITPELAALIARLAPPQTRTPAVEETVQKPEDKLGMSTTELANTLKMCGLQSGEESLLPAWFEKVNEKGQNDNTRNQIIINTLKNIMFDDAEIPITAPLLVMIRKRKWLSDDPVATYRTAAKGLSVFAVGTLTEDEVAIINDTMEALEQATTTTAKEYKDVTSIKAKVPKEAHDFLLLLKTFANLLYALFGSSCPLYIQVRAIIRSFTTYSRTAMKALSMAAKAAVLWILLLQTRHFAAGNQTTLAEFRNMADKVTAKDSNITHAEVPAAFLIDDDKRKRKREDAPAEDNRTPVTPKGNDQGNPVTPSPDRKVRVHPLIKEKIIDNVVKQNPNTPIRKICRFANTELSKLSKDPSKCVLGMLGSCRSRFCRRKHVAATDEEAKHMVMLLEKAILNPDQIGAFEG
jgi:hypothetical protein